MIGRQNWRKFGCRYWWSYMDSRLPRRSDSSYTSSLHNAYIRMSAYIIDKTWTPFSTALSKELYKHNRPMFIFFSIAASCSFKRSGWSDLDNNTIVVGPWSSWNGTSLPLQITKARQHTKHFWSFPVTYFTTVPLFIGLSFGIAAARSYPFASPSWRDRGLRRLEVFGRFCAGVDIDGLFPFWESLYLGYPSQPCHGGCLRAKLALCVQ